MEKPTWFGKVLDVTKQLANAGNSEMNVVLGLLFTGEREVEKSFSHFKEAAKKGHPFGEYACGVVYLSGSTAHILDPEHSVDETIVLHPLKF